MTTPKESTGDGLTGWAVDLCDELDAVLSAIIDLKDRGDHGYEATSGTLTGVTRAKTLNKTSGASFEEWIREAHAEVDALAPGFTTENLDPWRAAYESDEFVAEVVARAIFTERACPRELVSNRSHFPRNGVRGCRRRHSARQLVARRRR
jgi:hypothetical protein